MLVVLVWVQCCLIHKNQEHVVAYYSKILSKPEGQYCVTRREFLAIVQSIKHFDHYLYGTQLLVRTDHGALNWLLYFKNPGQMVLRSWLHIILQFNIGRVGNITMLTVFVILQCALKSSSDLVPH
jgi:hypothetical protein